MYLDARDDNEEELGSGRTSATRRARGAQVILLLADGERGAGGEGEATQIRVAPFCE